MPVVIQTAQTPLRLNVPLVNFEYTSIGPIAGWSLVSEKVGGGVVATDASPNSFAVTLNNLRHELVYDSGFSVYRDVIFVDFEIDYTDEQQAEYFEGAVLRLNVSVPATWYHETGGPTTGSGIVTPHYRLSSPSAFNNFLTIQPGQSIEVEYDESDEEKLNLTIVNFNWGSSSVEGASSSATNPVNSSSVETLHINFGDGLSEEYPLTLLSGTEGTATLLFYSPSVYHQYIDAEEEVVIENNYYVIDQYGRKSQTLTFTITPPAGSFKNPMVMHPAGLVYSASKNGTSTLIERRIGGPSTKELVSEIEGVRPIALERQKGQNGRLYLLGKDSTGAKLYQSKNNGEDWQQMGQAFDNSFKTHDMEVLEPSGIKLAVATKDGQGYARISFNDGTDWEEPDGFSPVAMPDGFKTGSIRQKSVLGKETIVFSDNTTFQFNITKTGAVWTAIA